MYSAEPQSALPSEIAGYADVVPPEDTFLERYDELGVGFGRTGWTSLRQPVAAFPNPKLKAPIMVYDGDGGNAAPQAAALQ